MVRYLMKILVYYLGLYDTWSSYKPETDGVFIAYASIHGHTKEAAEKLAEIFKEKGVKDLEIADVSRTDISECVSKAFRYSKIVFAAASYDAGVFAPMHDFLSHLISKGYRNRKVALVENGSWGPTAAKTMKAMLEEMKDITICENTVTIRSAMKAADVEKLGALADELLK